MEELNERPRLLRRGLRLEYATLSWNVVGHHAARTIEDRRERALTGSTLKLAALIVPLGLDTFGVAIALGIAGVPRQRRLRIAFLFAGFEAAMPLLGVALGAPLGHAIGSAADYGAAALILALGAYLLVADEDDDVCSHSRAAVCWAPSCLA